MFVSEGCSYVLPTKVEYEKRLVHYSNKQKKKKKFFFFQFFLYFFWLWFFFFFRFLGFPQKITPPPWHSQFSHFLADFWQKNLRTATVILPSKSAIDMVMTTEKVISYSIKQQKKSKKKFCFRFFFFFHFENFGFLPLDFWGIAEIFKYCQGGFFGLSKNRKNRKKFFFRVKKNFFFEKKKKKFCFLFFVWMMN